MVAPAGAGAALSWSGPFAVEPSTSGENTLNLACPSTTQCTLVDEFWGHTLIEPAVEVTFDPLKPSSPTPVVIDSTGSTGNVACPSTTQCTTVAGGDEITFDPHSPGSPTPVTIAAAGSIGGGLLGVACPSRTQCTAVGLEGEEVTFDPTSPGSPTQATVDNRLDSVACPSTTLCTAVGPYGPLGTDGDLVTFDPSSPGSPGHVSFEGFAPYSVACPSSSRCMAVGLSGARYGYGGVEVTFDPRSPGSPTPAAIGHPGKPLSEVACPSASDCVALASLGEVLEGDPGAPSSFKAVPLPRFQSVTETNALACASATECVADDQLGDVWVGVSGATVNGALTSVGQGHPKLTLKVATGGAGAGVLKVTIALPQGLSFDRGAFAARAAAHAAARAAAHRRCHGKANKRRCKKPHAVKGLSVAGAKVKSAKLRHGKLVITLRKASSSFRIKTGGTLISASDALRRKVREHKIKTLEVALTMVDAKHHVRRQKVRLSAG